MESNWTSVIEKLPEQEQLVLIYVKTNWLSDYKITTGWICSDKNKWYSRIFDGWEGKNFKVTHWMMLPNPPRNA